VKLFKVFIPILFSGICILFAQTPDSSKILYYQNIANRIFTSGLDSGQAYKMLKELTDIGPRISGSEKSWQAINWASSVMQKLNFQNVHTEKCMVPHWVRGPIEEALVVGLPAKKEIRLSVCALGGSVSTPETGITAEVLEVKSFEELKAKSNLAKGKIIFYNRPMDRGKINAGEAYEDAVDQRFRGAIDASKVGGVAALVRSMTTQLDDVPHTGVMGYDDSIQKIPSAAISTVGADLLSNLLKAEKQIKIYLKLTSQTLPDTESANVMGEITGTEKPGEVIVVGGHLDSWDKGTGAHDDAAGCVQAIEVVRILKELDLKPKRTIRAVMFMNEENGTRGGRAYAENLRANEKHILALESDGGGFMPKGFGVTADSVTFEKIKRWEYLFQPINADRITKGGGGVDISPLGRKGVATAGLRVDGQKYFDYHHSDNDTFDKVNERELEIGAAAMAILVYVISAEGL
jgi:carboxypeptidase Q